MDNSKDLMLAILGASVSLAGLLLVFSGFLFTQAESMPPEHTDDKAIGRLKAAARFGLLPFVACLVVTLLSAFWLKNPNYALFQAAWSGFLVLLAGTGIYGVVVIYRYL